MLQLEFFNVSKGILSAMSTLLFLAGSLFGLLAQEASASCSYQPPQIEVTTQFDGPTLDRSQSSASLGASLGNESSEFTTQGVTRTKSYVKRNISVSFSQMRDGQLCANIQQISVLVALEGPAQVFVASEVEPGSCRDRVTIEHEQLHINHAFEAQQKTKEAIEQKLPSALRRILPVVARDGDQAVAMIGAHLDGIIDQISAPIDAERSAKDRAIDTRESYKRLTAMCP
ncbi:hypothetical protein [Rhizobium sp. MHM7A]|uniref:hypothetical protein n=1 Tax=Rhizobium sp. MHM7A TaxID=2583233 RepID=UPI001105C849|nr:hypothetical protein [Rhizobium sp. MHM7A]TLX17032.1 hypothetical protein FFR93_06875 [Rhizobium sp. MHM7A]